MGVERELQPEGTDRTGRIGSNKKVSPNLSFPLTDFSHTVLFTMRQEHALPCPLPSQPQPPDLHGETEAEFRKLGQGHTDRK